jgi:hypothetical protein
MSGNKKLFIILVGTVLSVNLLLLVLLHMNRQRLSDEISRQHNSMLYLEYRFTESVSINNSMHGRRLGSFADGVTGRGELAGSGFADSLRSSYLIVFGSNTCPPCIPEALSIAAKLLPDESGKRFFVVSNYANPLGLFLVMEENGIKRSRGIHSYELVESLVGNLQTPVLLKMNDYLVVEKACFLEKDLPFSFYQRFISD